MSVDIGGTKWNYFSSLNAQQKHTEACLSLRREFDAFVPRCVRVHVLPSQRVLFSGRRPDPCLFSHRGSQWKLQRDMRSSLRMCVCMLLVRVVFLFFFFFSWATEEEKKEGEGEEEEGNPGPALLCQHGRVKLKTILLRRFWFGTMPSVAQTEYCAVFTVWPNNVLIREVRRRVLARLRSQITHFCVEVKWRPFTQDYLKM